MSPLELKDLRVLVVDESTTMQTILHHYITSWGMRNGHAANGDQAIEILRKAAAEGHPYDVAILDRATRGTDGLKLAHAIKADPTISDVNLVMLGSRPSLDDHEIIGPSGITAYLNKPIRQSELYNCLMEAMGKAAGNIGSPCAHTPIPAQADPTLAGRILLAEDNAINQEVAKTMLETLGCAVDVVMNGVEALAALRKTPYDLVLMDCQMPEMDGYEATGMIRKREHSGTNHTPVIAMTAHAMQDARQECLAAGMDDYLSKPFSRNQLQAILTKWLPRESGQGEKPSPRPPSLEEPHTVPKQPVFPSAHIDPKVLRSLCDLKRPGAFNFLRKFIATYLNTSPDQVQTIREAVTNNDANSMQRAAHSFKSSNGYMGAKRLASLCKDLEEMGRANATEGAQRLLAQIEVEHKAVQEALKKELTSI